jgi:hypothetical protein
MTFTKKKLAYAVSSGFLLSFGMANQAFAVQDLELNNDTDTTNDVAPLTYSASLNIDASEGLDLLDGPGNAQDVTGIMNTNNTPADTDVRLTVTLDNEATFVEDPAASLASSAASILTGGAGTSSVVFFSDTGTAGFASTETFEVFIEGVNVVNQDAVGIQVDFQIADNFGVTDIRTINDSYIAFEDQFAVSADLSGAQYTTIDVTANSLFFVEGSESEVTEANIGALVVEDNTPLSASGETLLGAEVATDIDVSITATNGLAAFAEEAGGNVFYEGATEAMVVEGTSAVSADLEFGEISGENTFFLSVDSENTTQIAETDLSATVAGTAVSAEFNTDSLDQTVSLASLSRNGSSARLTFALTPGGAYPMYVRITNPSAIDGPATIQLINDDGDSSSSLSLTDVGEASDDLVAGASTGLINIDDIFAAAEDGGFALGTDNKLRIEVVAEFGTTGQDTGVVAGAFSLSSDGTTFNMMTDASN